MDSGKTMNKEVPDFENWIEWDKERIKTDIINKGVHDEHGIHIKRWEGESDSEYYIGNIKKNNFSFIGVLSNNLQRQNYGLNTFENGDHYFGYFHGDSRAKHGAYFWAPKNKNGRAQSEMYHGFWREGKRSDRGVYLWIDEKINNHNFDQADFDCFIGEFESDLNKRGCYLSKQRDNYYVYYGSYDSDGKKSDDRGFFYSSKQEKLIIGKIHKDSLLNGHILSFKDDGTIKDIFYCEFDSEGMPCSYVRSEDLASSTREEMSQTASEFREIILSYDVFGQVYQNYKQLRTFISNEARDVSVFDDSEGYPKIMKLCSSYNDITVYNSLEKAFPR